jgi:hypothetical protein
VQWFEFDFDASIMAWMCRPPAAVGGKEKKKRVWEQKKAIGRSAVAG